MDLLEFYPDQGVPAPAQRVPQPADTEIHPLCLVHPTLDDSLPRSTARHKAFPSRALPTLYPPRGLVLLCQERLLGT